MLVQARILQDESVYLSHKEKDTVWSYNSSSLVEVFVPAELDAPFVARRLLSPALKLGEIPLAQLKEQARKHSLYAAFTPEEFVIVSGFGIAIARARFESRNENPLVYHYIASRVKSGRSKETTCPHYYRATDLLHQCIDHWRNQRPETRQYPSLPYLINKEVEKINTYLSMRG